MTTTARSVATPDIETWTTLAHGREDTTELVLIRHGRTAANRAGVFQGSMDVPLDDLGAHELWPTLDGRTAHDLVDLLDRHSATTGATR